MSRNVSLDLLRILSCFGVIMIHTSGFPIIHHLVEPGTLWFSECLILDALSRFSVPVFAMLTGYFMLDPQKELSVKKLFSKHIIRIVIALTAWSVFYALSLNMPLYPFGSQGGHFWYLGMLVGLYLSIPILRLIAYSPSVLPYFCWIWLFFMLYQFLGHFVELPYGFDPICFVDYAGYCLWGYYIKIIPKVNLLVYLLGFLGLVITIVAALIAQDGETCFFGYSSPNVIAFSLALFCLFEKKVRVKKLNPRIRRLIESCSMCTFGIYLIHMWLLIQLFSRIHRFIPQPILLSIICVGVTFCIGWGITYALKRIPIANKYLV